MAQLSVRLAEDRRITELSVWPERSLFYLAKMYAEQINPGDSYNKFKKCVSISILDFKLFEDTEDFYSRFHIAEDSRHTLYTDKMEFHVLELPKLPKELKGGSDNLLLWAKFINAERKEEFAMIATKDPYIESAYQALQVISQDKEKRMEYEAQEKAIRDHNQFLFEARQKGREEGRKEGREENSLVIAEKLIKLGYPIKEIMLITDLSGKQIDKLR